GPGRQLRRLRSVRRVQRHQIAVDTLLNLLLTVVDLAGREVLVAGVDGLEFAAIDGNQGLVEQPEITAQGDEAPTHVADARTIVTAKVCDGLQVRGQTTSEPHQFDITLALSLQPTTGLDPIQVAVDIDLQ